MKNKIAMSHNACFVKLFDYIGESHYGFNVSVGDVVYMTDVELYGVVVSISNDGDVPCFYVSYRTSSGLVSHCLFTRSDCHFCRLPSPNTVVRLVNGVARVGSPVMDVKFDGVDTLIVSKVDSVRGRCFVIRPRRRPIDRSCGYWCPVSDLVLKV